MFAAGDERLYATHGKRRNKDINDWAETLALRVFVEINVPGSESTWSKHRRGGETREIDHTAWWLAGPGDEQNPIITGEAGMYCTGVFLKILSRSGR